MRTGSRGSASAGGRDPRAAWRAPPRRERRVLSVTITRARARSRGSGQARAAGRARPTAAGSQRSAGGAGRRRQPSPRTRRRLRDRREARGGTSRVPSRCSSRCPRDPEAFEHDGRRAAEGLALRVGGDRPGARRRSADHAGDLRPEPGRPGSTDARDAPASEDGPVSERAAVSRIVNGRPATGRVGEVVTRRTTSLAGAVCATYR